MRSKLTINEVFNARLRSISILKKNYVELLSIEGLTIFEIDKTIHEIIKSIECTPENYKRLLEDNSSLRKQLDENNNSICNYGNPGFRKPSSTANRVSVNLPLRQTGFP